MSKNKFSLRRLFSNTKFLVVFSIVVALFFWIAVALEYAPVIERDFKNIPVTIDLKNSVPEKFGLQFYSNQEFTVDFTVRGSRYIIGGDLIDADDFDISVQTAYVNSTGNHALQISITPKNPNSEYEVVSFSPQYFEAYFDKPSEREIKVEPRIITELSGIVDSDYIMNENEIIMAEKSVKISGPKTEVDRIENAYADINIKDKLTQNLSLDAPITLEKIDGDEVKFVKIDAGGKETIPITIPVYKTESLKTNVNFKNIPSEYIDKPLAFTVSPEEIKAGVLQDGVKNLTELNIGTIDYSQISPKNNSFTFYTKDIENIRVLDRTEKLTVKISTDGFSSAKLKAADNSVVFAGNDKNGFSYDISSLGDITVVGPAASVKQITADSLVVSVDSANIEKAVNGVVPVEVSLKNIDDCWIYGTYNLKIAKK